MPPAPSSTKAQATDLASAKRNRQQLERLYGIVARIQSSHRVTAQHLADEFEVTLRTIYRDIEFLRDRLQVEVVFDQEAKTYTLPSDFKNLPAMEIGENDLLVLAFLDQCLAAYAGTEIGEMMRQSFQKMFGLLSSSKSWKKWETGVWFRFQERPEPSMKRKEIYFFHQLHRAIEKCRAADITYASKDGEESIRRIFPQLLSLYKGKWYLYGWSPEDKTTTVMVLHRMRELKVRDETFEAGQLPSPRELLAHSFGVAISEKAPEPVVLKFAASLASRVQETLWHPGQKVDVLPDGSVRLTLPLSNTLEIRPWILSWGPYVTVLSPPELVQEMRGIIEQMLANQTEP